MEKEGFFTLHSYAATGISRWPLLQDSYFQPRIHPKFSERSGGFHGWLDEDKWGAICCGRKVLIKLNNGCTQTWLDFQILATTCWNMNSSFRLFSAATKHLKRKQQHGAKSLSSKCNWTNVLNYFDRYILLVFFHTAESVSAQGIEAFSTWVLQLTESDGNNPAHAVPSPCFASHAQGVLLPQAVAAFLQKGKWASLQGTLNDILQFLQTTGYLTTNKQGEFTTTSSNSMGLLADSGKHLFGCWKASPGYM